MCNKMKNEMQKIKNDYNENSKNKQSITCMHVKNTR